MATNDTAETRPLNIITNGNNVQVTEDPPPKTFCEKFKSVYTNITVEPAAFMMLFSSILSSIATQTLGLEKACRVSLELGDEICYSLRIQNTSNNFSDYEALVQAHVSARLVWKSAIQSALPCIILIFVGSWSDKTGRRKIVMICPIVGEIFQCSSNIINVVFFYQLPLEVLIFFDAFFGSIAGGWSVTFLALFSYISDITTKENRTHRLGLVNFFSFAGMPLGLAISGIMLKGVGYYAVYGLSLGIHIVNVIYIIFSVSDPPRSEEQRKHDNRGFWYFLKTFFDIRTIKETLRVVFRKAPNNRRCHLIVLLGVTIFLFIPTFGEASISYMLTRYRFNWNELQYSIFQTYNFVLNSIGTVFSIFVFSKYLKWHDSILGIISTTSKIASSFVYAFAPNATIFYIGPLVDILNGTSVLAVRSIYSKLVEPNELGKMNSIVGVTETLLPVIAVSLYTQVYTNTMSVMPGAVYLLGATTTVPGVLVFIWLFFEHRKILRQEKAKTNHMPMS
ncbi:hypothetical protein K1T71_004694 [Dendrolimus kikuchii]|uniref:Uncharacterized protein n=1 Tax=Dendrolimus kikuchii TaxID=765133 RepID=A0ACC1D933_9NEOP|nr:hypothetical protein K1T71_004694 [Dendrolimus kikuchii]